MERTDHEDSQSPGDTPKRRRVTRACDFCKSRKKACAGNLPCPTCVKQKIKCTYETAYNRGIAAPPRSSTDRENRPSQAQSQTGQASYPPSRRISADLEESTGIVGQYSGPASAHSFLGRAIEKVYHGEHPPVLSPLESQHLKTVSIFSFGDREVPKVDSANMTWPDRRTALELSRRYFEFGSPTYRVLHQGTVNRWIEEDFSNKSATIRAIGLMVFAMASMFRQDSSGALVDADDLGWRQSERYYEMAQQLLHTESGAPSLASAQARFVTSLYLLSSSRVNKAWYVFGTVMQLLVALGLHRKRRPNKAKITLEQSIIHECEKRTLWCAFTLDKYLSLMLGRPRMLQEDDVNQEFPAMVNDEDLFRVEISTSRPSRDCVMAASVFHMHLAQILARAAKELYASHPKSAAKQAESIARLTDEVLAWHNRLPHTLSGTIHPSSLIPIFRRQLTVLQLAEYHAIMFVTRPFLLRDYSKILPELRSYQSHLHKCVLAAKDTLELSLSFAKEQQLFAAFWYTQYIMFNALSVIYIYLIQVHRGRIPRYDGDDAQSSSSEERSLYELADKAHSHLGQATIRNSPVWRYSAVLQGLRAEIASAVGNRRNGLSNQLGLAGTEKGNEMRLLPARHNPFDSESNLGNASDSSFTDNPSYAAFPVDLALTEPNQVGLFDSFLIEDDLNLDFWTQMDTYPICEGFTAFSRLHG